MSRVAAKSQIAVVATALLMVASLAAATHAAPNLEQLGRSCSIYGCPVQDRLGGVGLKPARTYRLVDGTDTICADVVRTFNDTLRKPVGALARVTLPVPLHHDLDPPTDPPPRGAHVRDKPTYQAQNPLYSSPMFLRWRYLGGNPFLLKNDPVRTYIHEDGYLARWQIVRLLNGRRYLMTIIGHWDPGYLVPPVKPYIWDVPEDELDAHDWTIPASYYPFKPFPLENPLVSWLYTKTFPPSRRDLNQLCQEYANPAAHREPYCAQTTAKLVVNFVEKNSRIYVVVADANLDLITIYAGDEGNTNRAHSMCHIDSTLSRTLTRNRNDPRWIPPPRGL